MHTITLTKNLPDIHNFSSYVQFVMNIPYLSDEEERGLLEKFKLDNCLTSVQTLILSQLKTVVKIAYSFKNYGLPQEDLVQEGTIGLMKAVKNFDINQRVRLYSYAVLWIKSEMQGFILKNWKLVKIGTTKNMKKLFFNFRKTQKEMIDNGISKLNTYSYIARKLNVQEEEVAQIESYFSSDEYSISDDYEEKETDDFGLKTQLIEYQTPESIVEENHDSIINKNALSRSISILNEKQKEVIKMRYYEDDKMTHKEISKILGVSSERVRQIEQEALERMKTHMISSS